MLWVALMFLQAAGAAEILYVAPFAAISHYQMMEPLMMALHERGHRITVLSHYPRSEPLPNYTDISLRGTEPAFQVSFAPWKLFEDTVDLFRFGATQCENLISSKIIQDFLSRDQKFDLLFLEPFDSDCYLGFVKKFQAPYILCSSMPLTVWHGDWVYNYVDNTIPDHMCRLGGQMDYFGRIQNFLCRGFLRVVNYLYNTRVAPDIVRRHFHIQLDDLEDVKSNVSMMFVNSHHSITGARPLRPNILELAGIHLKEPQALPPKIGKFLNESTGGAIVFSMGSIVRAHTAEPGLRDAFVEAFRNRKERVLWKWEADLENRPENVMTVDWMPQSDVLAHENVKLFISHGGIHGVIESIRSGVPILGIPLYGDQESNLKHLEAAGAAIKLNLHEITAKTLTEALDRMMQDEKYIENARKVSRLLRDRPETPLNSAVFWTEHVLRTGGAPHFRSGTNLKWYAYFSIDVWIVSILIIIFFHFFLKIFTNYLIFIIKKISFF